MTAGDVQDPRAQHPARFEFDDVVVDRRNYRVLKAGQPRPLGPRAFDLLIDLLQHAGRVVEKQELFQRVWKGIAVTDNALSRAVKEIRQAIGDEASAPRYVETVARRGYRFAAPVRSPLAPRVMLAVLPFADLGRDPRDPEDSFCDGLTEELIMQIAQLNAHRLGVIARTSAMAYKNSRRTVDEIARVLGVDYVLEGSVRREGGRVRISAQLIDARDQSHVWANSYEDGLGDLRRAQRRTAEEVARAVRIELEPDGARPASVRSIDPEAYTAYLRGRDLLTQRTTTASRAALHAFQRALAREPTFAPAHVGLARCCCIGFMLGLMPRADVQPLAKAAVQRALELDDRIGEAHATRGALESAERHYDAAERAFRHAIMLDPNDATTRHWYAMLYLLDLGCFEEALAELRVAQVLDPLALVVQADIAAVFHLMREDDRALRQCRRVLELDPMFARAHLYAGCAHAQRGELDQAVTEFEIARRLDASPWSAGWLGYGYGRAGRRSEAEHVLRELRQAASTGRDVALFEALVQMGLGETSRACDDLERALAEQSLGLGMTRFNPAFLDPQTDARFARLVSQIGPPGLRARAR